MRWGARIWLVGIVGLAALVVGCGGSSDKQSRQDSIDSIASEICNQVPSACKPNKAKPKPAPSSRPASGGCITTGGYGGLYSTVGAFNSKNPTTQPSQPIPGVAVYRVLSTSHGCVSAYSVDELTHPPQSASEIVFLTDGIGLPNDNTTVDQSGGCVVYSSSTLTQASGFKFAKAEGTAQSGSTPAHAEIHLTNSGSC